MRDNHCAACGATDNLQYHHLMPRSMGGSDDERNLITLCGECHAKAHEVRANWRMSELTRKALQAKKARGERTGSIPYGYTLADDGKTLEPNHEEQRAVREAHRIATRGLSLRKVAAELARRGFYARNGAQFEAEQVRRMVAALQATQPEARP
jgi:hypothetical protein